MSEHLIDKIGEVNISEDHNRWNKLALQLANEERDKSWNRKREAYLRLRRNYERHLSSDNLMERSYFRLREFCLRNSREFMNYVYN